MDCSETSASLSQSDSNLKQKDPEYLSFEGADNDELQVPELLPIAEKRSEESVKGLRSRYGQGCQLPSEMWHVDGHEKDSKDASGKGFVTVLGVRDMFEGGFLDIFQAGSSSPHSSESIANFLKGEGDNSD